MISSNFPLKITNGKKDYGFFTILEKDGLNEHKVHEDFINDCIQSDFTYQNCEDLEDRFVSFLIRSKVLEQTTFPPRPDHMTALDWVKHGPKYSLVNIKFSINGSIQYSGMIY